MARVRDGYPQWHSRDNEGCVDQLIEDDSETGVLFEDVEIVGERTHHFLICIDGVDHFIPRGAIIGRESTVRDVGDRGAVSIREQTAIAKGLC